MVAAIRDVRASMTVIPDNNPRKRPSELVYAEGRLSAWAAWAKDRRHELGYPSISTLYKGSEATKVQQYPAFVPLASEDLGDLVRASLSEVVHGGDGPENRFVFPLRGDDLVDDPEVIRGIAVVSTLHALVASPTMPAGALSLVSSPGRPFEQELVAKTFRR